MVKHGEDMLSDPVAFLDISNEVSAPLPRSVFVALADSKIEIHLRLHSKIASRNRFWRQARGAERVMDLDGYFVANLVEEAQVRREACRELPNRALGARLTVAHDEEHDA